ncbi:hypothetical protein PQJ75_03510 [Rhodoplanes sp. TEM]|uniref:Uncharacterized protein n=1 Tax=Rhodoplanes tepidamans TaxID=200616 RepID=A0ABT5J8X8_RHOTP|nr:MULTISPECIES: hypothetical protein [Rhodoplanes]MDC7786118.1 hypothetical protein [Rhodoplanes tepidamans]MDC7982785.1 hypothetical protein [Rhodoplanes sp. TEM]MDQ0357217.1 hypothetical protein [Rhodoplanes tepidamans]
MIAPLRPARTPRLGLAVAVLAALSIATAGAEPFGPGESSGSAATAGEVRHDWVAPATPRTGFGWSIDVVCRDPGPFTPGPPGRGRTFECAPDGTLALPPAH